MFLRHPFQVGWLTKRTRKQANWTNWLKRWFVLVPGRLTYYESNDMKVHKGEIVLDRRSAVEDLPITKEAYQSWPIDSKLLRIMERLK